MSLQEKRAAASLRTTVNGDWKYDIIAHSSRLVRPAQAMAWELGLTREKVRRVGLAALLHDLGKFALPGTILQKPGPLSIEEWDLVRRHPDIGCRIIQRLGGLWEGVALIVAAHHERWDGRGYPRGLVREQIPLEARILAVVDAFDAMTTPRVYRASLSVEEAREELARCSGQQFDPRVVEVFLRIEVRQPHPEVEKKLLDLDGSQNRYRRIYRRGQRRLITQGA